MKWWRLGIFGAAACWLMSGHGLLASDSAPAGTRAYSVHGVVKELDPDGRTVVIRHEAISNYMAAMTMPFAVRDPALLRGLTTNDEVDFHLVVTPTEGWIDRMQKTAAGSAAPAVQTPAPGFTIRRAVEPLDEGQLLPDYGFTNELGRAIRFSQYSGGPFAFTFFFTSCPYPDFCPRMTSQFAAAAARLSAATNAPAQWHLFSISFDPKTDTPERLHTYAGYAHYDPAHWSFLTGDSGALGELADNVGERYWAESNSISHNLRTVVVDRSLHIRKIFPGNHWTSDDLVDELIKAAQ